MLRFFFKLNQLSPMTSDFHETLQGLSAAEYLHVYGEFLFNIDCQSKYMEDFVFYKTNWNPRLSWSNSVIKPQLLTPSTLYMDPDYGRSLSVQACQS